MKSITLKGNWVIKAPREEVYKIITDFENMPKNFPGVAESMKITSKNGNNLQIGAKARSFGRVFKTNMKTRLLPGKGFISDNESEIGTKGHEEFLLEDASEGTRINYKYDVDLNNRFLQIFAGPLLKWYAMWYWKRAFIDKLKKILEK